MATTGDTAATFCTTLVDEWVSAGVRHAMVAPGSRSTPMALALTRDAAIEVHVFHDERSAAFAALGVGLATGMPAVVLCSSGTAAAHFHAAVIEAHQSNVPMIVCTADRPPHLRDVAAPQTIDQTKIYGDAVRWFHDPGVPDVRVAHTWRSLAARAHQISVGARPGPVHLNLPFDEPLYGEPINPPVPREGSWSVVGTGSRFDEGTIEMMAAQLRARHGVFVAGKGAPRNLVSLAEMLGWPVLCDSRAILERDHESVIDCFDPILRVASFVDGHRPDIVVLCGEPPASKVLGQWLVSTGTDLVQWSRHPGVVDPFHRTASQLVGDLESLVESLRSQAASSSPSWVRDWIETAEAARSAIDRWVDANWSEITVAHTVAQALEPGSHLVVSSSMPIRDVEWFAKIPGQAVVHSNRGANGIDGVLSTAIGVALATGAATRLLIGDVALLHDSAGLVGLARRGLDLRIVVTNNDGGSIFSFLPQARLVSAETFETIYGTPHGVDLAALSNAHGVTHRIVESREELRAALTGSGVAVIEARFDRGANVAAHDALNETVARAIEAIRP